MSDDLTQLETVQSALVSCLSTMDLEGIENKDKVEEVAIKLANVAVATYLLKDGIQDKVNAMDPLLLSELRVLSDLVDEYSKHPMRPNVQSDMVARARWVKHTLDSRDKALMVTATYENAATSWYKPSKPENVAVGDFWVDTSSNNHDMYRAISAMYGSSTQFVPVNNNPPSPVNGVSDGTSSANSGVVGQSK